MPWHREETCGRLAIVMIVFGVLSGTAAAQAPPRFIPQGLAPPPGSPLPAIRPQVAPEVQPGSLS